MTIGLDNTDRESERIASIAFYTLYKEISVTLGSWVIFLPAKLQYIANSDLKKKSKRFKLHQTLQSQASSLKSVGNRKKVRYSQT